MYRSSVRRVWSLVILTALVVPALLACAGAPSPTPTSGTSAVGATPPSASRATQPAKATAASEPTKPPAATSTPSTPVESVVNVKSMQSPDSAVQVFLWGNPKTDQQLQLAKDGGFHWVKQSFEWRYVEPHNKNVFDWNEPDRVVDAVNKSGLKLIARVDNQPIWARPSLPLPAVGPPDKMSDYTDFVSAMATRYKGRIQAYEIWNEPNLAREWGNQPPDAKAYTQMVQAAYKAIKAIDPDAVVITAGMAPTTASGDIATPDVEFLTQMYAAGLKGNFDLVGAHAAGYKATPEMSPDDIAKDPALNHGEGAAGRIYGFRHVEDLRTVMVANGDSNKGMAILEMGWTSDNRPNSPYAWHSVTEDQKADYLVRAFAFAKTHWVPWIGIMSVIYECDPNWTADNEQYYWCITNPDGSVRPAYTALKKAFTQ